MLYFRFLVVLLAFACLVSCSSPGGSITKAASAEITAQDVVDAWDLHCALGNLMSARQMSLMLYATR